MRPFIGLTAFSSDDDPRQVRITVCDGDSTLVMSAYVGLDCARFHWFPPTQLLITTRQQSDFFQYKDTQVAREAILFLRCEPASPDQFVADLHAMHTGSMRAATLHCIPLDGA